MGVNKWRNRINDVTIFCNFVCCIKDYLCIVNNRPVKQKFLCLRNANWTVATKWIETSTFFAVCISTSWQLIELAISFLWDFVSWKKWIVNWYCETHNIMHCLWESVCPSLLKFLWPSLSPRWFFIVKMFLFVGDYQVTDGHGVTKPAHIIVLKKDTDCHHHSGSGLVIGKLFMFKMRQTMTDGNMLLIFQGWSVYVFSLQPLLIYIWLIFLLWRYDSYGFLLAADDTEHSFFVRAS